jgi:ABC-2 type transport system ATP-binding protein
MIKVTNIIKTYNKKTVLNISDLTVNDGEIFGLVGNNGAGKTTLLRLLLDLIRAEKGEVSSGDHVVARTEEWKEYTASYLDEGFLIDYLTPEEFFGFIAEEYRINKEELNRRLAEFSHFFNGEVLGQSRKYIRDFSKGNKQKIGIASALITEPAVLILDEPFNSLDPTSQILLKKMLTDYNRRTGATMIISSHDLNHVTEICTRIAIIEKGIIIRDLQNNGQAMAELASYFSVRQ